MAFFFVGCTGQTGWKLINGEQALLCNHVQTVTFFLSLGTNAIATFLIAYKAWYVSSLLHVRVEHNLPTGYFDSHLRELTLCSISGSQGL